MPDVKHPRPVRWLHWLNLAFFGLMAWSGLRIYWANDVYLPLPDRFYSLLRLDYALAYGMAVHFSVAWLFTLNGLAYVAYTVFSGEWRELLPKRSSWRQAAQVVLHDLGLTGRLPLQGRYNAAQRISYTGTILMGAGLVVTGLDIYKPTQLAGLTRLLGGYPAARREHFWLMFGMLAFLLVHVVQVARAGWVNLRAMLAGFPPSGRLPEPSAERRLTRRALLTGGAAAALGGSAWAWVLTRPESDGLMWPLRKVLTANGELWQALFRPSCRAPESGQTLEGEARLNGDLGLEGAVDSARWRLRVLAGDGQERALSLAEVRALPRVELTTALRCIEGWSDENTFAGARFSELLRRLRLAPSRYAGLETPDRGYYVSLDMATMLHPQTLLVYEMNGEPLAAAHGAPLRLFTPLKYGIKSLKRIGLIRLSDSRPPDYWEERGYDWYAGL